MKESEIITELKVEFLKCMISFRLLGQHCCWVIALVMICVGNFHPYVAGVFQSVPVKNWYKLTGLLNVTRSWCGLISTKQDVNRMVYFLGLSWLKLEGSAYIS